MLESNERVKYQNLYIHVPFCRQKCDYCAFYSVPFHHETWMKQWLQVVLTHLKKNEEQLSQIHTVYLGGGTPTLLPDGLLDELLNRLKSLLPDSQAEFSIEANPCTVTPEKAKLLARYVNRVSLGVQSFHQDTLDMLGRRRYDGPNPEEAVFNLRESEIQNIGIDLIYGVPNQSLQSWCDDLRQAMNLDITHVSAYSIVSEKGTPYEIRTSKFPENDALQQDMWMACEKILNEKNFSRYEISNYAKQGCLAKHNWNIWHGETYLGIGPSAVSFNGKDRFQEVPDLRNWLHGAPPVFDKISHEARAAEILMMGLRTTDGWTSEDFQKVTGMSWGFLEKELNELIDMNLLEFHEQNLRPTQMGLTFWNTVGETIVRFPA